MTKKVTAPTAGEPIMTVVTAAFPNASGEARPLSALAIWRIARNVRQQICGGLWPKPLAAETLIRRIQVLVVNGVRLKPHWDCKNEVHDEDGQPAIGVCEFDPDSPDAVYLSLNSAVIGDRPDLAASTAAHELGHAIFDIPAAALSFRQGPGLRRAFRHVTTDERHFRCSGPKDAVFWSEYRANEFMGGLLAPPDLLHRAMVMRASELGIGLTNSCGHAGKPGYPLLDGPRWDEGRQEALLDDLGETFGVSPAFIWVRLQKYRLIGGKP